MNTLKKIYILCGQVVSRYYKKEKITEELADNRSIKKDYYFVESDETVKSEELVKSETYEKETFNEDVMIDEKIVSSDRYRRREKNKNRHKKYKKE